MGSEHEQEIDPIKTNPNSHKAIGVVALILLLGGLGYYLRGSPLTMRRMQCPFSGKTGMTACPAMQTTPACSEPSDADKDADASSPCAAKPCEGMSAPAEKSDQPR